ncbi:hypothetical protein [Kribbella lupini]|uniref:PrgI family protein n=1 Tax=Kribbella lupini TaxID=291602 RepID=A0ABN2AVA4_9ACTN
MRSDREIAEMLAEREDPTEVGTGDKVYAIFYLASVVAVPVVVLCWAFELLGSREVYYAIPLFAAGATPWLLISDLCESHDRSPYSLLGLRTQLWLHLGGALPSALRTLRGVRAAVTRR